ncbi:YicC/YloC family endoribonuclease [Pseudalkalibacillus sp. SCS-8]
MKSMTGFGRAVIEDEHYSITTEIRSVNHRFSEIQIRLPRQLSIIEDKIKRCIQEYIIRGKVDVWISIDGERGIERELSVDWTLLDQYVEAHRQLNERLQADEELRYQQLLTYPNIVTITEREQVTDRFADQVLESVELASSKLIAMREDEGKHLKEDLLTRLQDVENILEEIRVLAPEVQIGYRDRLYKRIKDFTDGKLDLDDTRVLTEVAIFADKCNIDEELTRLDSHVSHFRDILEESGSIGRKMDFLVQEMNRESNTIGSKANDYSISKYVVQLKSEIEKLKEQVQNIE